MTWTQKGFAVVSVVSEAGGMPLLHSFHLPEWEANIAKDACASLPENLTQGLAVVPAVLTFEMPTLAEPAITP